MEKSTVNNTNDIEEHVENERLKGRNSQIWQLHLSGWTQERIGAKFGISHARVSQILKQIRASIPDPTRHELITTEIERLDYVLTKCWEVMEDTHLAKSGGRVVHDIVEYAHDEEGNILTDDNGNPVPAELRKLHDSAPILQAADRVIVAGRERRRLLGLDAPQRAEHSGPQGGPIPVDVTELSPDQVRRRAQQISEEVARAYENSDEAEGNDG